MITLAQTTLGELGPSIEVPRYDRARLRPGIVHFGVGNFHRVHLAVYLDRYLQEHGGEQWGICGVELIDTADTRAKAVAYRRQDNLYSVTEYAPDGTAATRVVGAMVDYLHAAQDPEAVLARLTNSETRIVSLTITEGGYNIDEVTGAFRLETPDVAWDLTGAPPRTAFGFIVEALRRRRESGLAPFTVMSCDNLRHNGDTARLAVVSFARGRDPELASWIDGRTAFPNSMVDRIAPQVSAASRERLNTRSGIDDALPAIGETFTQWVIEDRFSAGRPAFDTVGVEIRDDVVAFEFMKMRMLNACHMLLSYPGLLCGYTFVHEAMSDERLATLLETFLDDDTIPNLEAPSGVSLQAYKAQVLGRFKNPAIADQLLRIAHDGAAKIPVFHSRTLEMLLANGGDLRREAFFLACFARYLEGRNDQGEAIPVNEPHFGERDWTTLRGADPLALLKTEPFVRLRLDEHAAFSELFKAYRDSIASRSASETLDRLLADTRRPAD